MFGASVKCAFVCERDVLIVVLFMKDIVDKMFSHHHTLTLLQINPSLLLMQQQQQSAIRCASASPNLNPKRLRQIKSEGSAAQHHHEVGLSVCLFVLFVCLFVCFACVCFQLFVCLLPSRFAASIVLIN